MHSPPANSERRLNLHGVAVRVRSHLPSVIHELEHDFHYFLTGDGKQPAGERDSICAPLSVDVLPMARRPAGWRAALRGPRSVVY